MLIRIPCGWAVRGKARPFRGRMVAALVAVAVMIGLTTVVAAPASATTPSGIASLAQQNVGKGAGSCSQANSSPNSLGGTSFYSSCKPEFWCADFAKWVWANNGVNVAGLDAAAGSFITAAGLNGSTVHTAASYRPQVGDAMVLGWNGSAADHVGIVTQVNADGSILTANGDFNGKGTDGYFAVTSKVVSGTIPAADAHPGGTAFSTPTTPGMPVSAFVTPAGLSGGGGTVAPQPNTYPTLGAANIRAAATTSAPILNTVAQGTELTIDCYANGESVSGTSIWDHLRNGGYISDSLLYTGSSNPVVSSCSTPSNTYPTFENATVRTLSSELAAGVRAAPAGTQLTIDCYVVGELVEGTTIWDHVTSGGFVSDSHLLTGSASAVVPLCPAGILHGPFPTFQPGAVYSQPTTSSTTLASYPVGEYLTVDCYLNGASDGGTNLWDHVAGLGYISDSVVLTGSASPVVPGCQLSQTAPVPSIEGEAVSGATLTVKPGEWSPSPVSLSYQWLANGTILFGATAATLTIPASLVGDSISVAVTGSAAGLSSFTATSAATSPILSAANAPSTVPTISGTPQVGNTLTAHPGVFQVPVTPTYQWYASGQAISNATNSSLLLTNAFIGKAISVEVAGSGLSGSGQTSAPTAPVVSAPSATWTPTVSRLSGPDRYATAVAASQAGFPSGAPIAYLATGVNFPDALAAAAAAAKLGGPLLLTDPNSLPATVSAEIQRLHPTKVVIVGGTAVVSPLVQRQVTALTGGWSGSVTREAGSDRYETARDVVTAAFGNSVPTIFVATGQNYPDALSASAAAGAEGIPVLLVNGSAPSLDSATENLLHTLGSTSFRIAGGANAVSTGIASDLSNLGTVTRFGGADRYSTSELINKASFSSPKATYLATGSTFPDALTGAALSGFVKAPLYVVQPSCVPAATRSDLESEGVGNVTLLGGPNALGEGVYALSQC